jgi:hypothetical protein
LLEFYRAPRYFFALTLRVVGIVPPDKYHMRVIELLESDDPIGDLIAVKSAGFSPDPLDQLVDRFVAADTPKPVVKAPVKPAVAKAKPIQQPQQQAAKPVTIAQAPGSVAWTAVRDYLASKGLSKAHIIGMLANIQHESGFRPNVQVTDSNGLPSGGLFQHNGPRFQTLMNKLGKGWSQDWRGQIDFALSEPDGRRYLSNAFTDPHQASKWWTINFERPAKAKTTAQTRAKTATKFQQARK